MGVVDIAVLIFVYLACRWIVQLLTMRHRDADESHVVVVICNGQTDVADEWRKLLEPSRNGDELSEDERPKVIEVGGLRIKAYPCVREWHGLGAVSVKEGV
jgi:hypothetical protein